ncbi:MAG: DEAD/DEAH box helicase, partial [Bifidobacteriaceae bacterium]|nr:DEAD/DEAH box helicase [Bifidobacteriaceae bacterium]
MTSPAEQYAAFRRRERLQPLNDFAADLPFDLDSYQRDACEAVLQGKGVLVAAPTGAGKTVVATFAVTRALQDGRKAFYTTPIKALSNQKYREYLAMFGPERVGLLTGDVAINPRADLVIMTTEVLRNMMYANSPDLDNLSVVILDEVHYLADRFRGPVWEEVLIQLPAQVQVVSLSATVSNAEEFGAWLAEVRGQVEIVVCERRPVPLWQHVMTRNGLVDLYIPGQTDDAAPRLNPELAPLRAARRSGPGHFSRGRRHYGGPHRAGGPGGALRTPPRPAVIEALDREALLPAIFFVFSRAGCDDAVARCREVGLRLTDKSERDRIREIIEAAVATIPGADLDVLGYQAFLAGAEAGFAPHHAGMLPVFKQAVEVAFGLGLIKAVFATETLALGINMPARTVAMDRLDKWNGSEHAALTPGEYTQLTGRAGRRGIDIEGHAVVVVHRDFDPEAMASLASKRTYPLRSAFRPTYNMAINLIERVGRTQARDVLELSFAQFQADRAVVGWAREVRRYDEAITGYEQAMVCDKGDFAEYAELRRRLGQLEKQASRASAAARAAEREQILRGLKRGDIVRVRQGKYSGTALILDTGTDGPGGPGPLVLTERGPVRRLAARDLAGGLEPITWISLPKRFNGRDPQARRQQAAKVAAAVRASFQPPSPMPAAEAPAPTEPCASAEPPEPAAPTGPPGPP